MVFTKSAVGFFCSVALLSGAMQARAGDYLAVPVVLKAADVLGTEIPLREANYTIQDVVINDGMINYYKVDTASGTLKVQGTPMLHARLRELVALDRISKLEDTQVYKDALERGAKSPLKGAEALIDDPVATVKGAATGIGRWFSDVGRSIASDDPNQAGVAETALGQAATKRAFAYEFGVDPYTTFTQLQQALDKVSWTAVAGGMTTKVAFALIPGAAGTVVSVAGTTDSTRALVRDNSPAQLEKINLDKLAKMGVGGTAAKSFIKNNSYTPQDKSILVSELETMKSVKNRAVFVRAASSATDQARAFFMVGRAQMMANFMAQAGSKAEFIELDGTLFLKTANGSLVGAFPIDFLAYTEGFAKKLAAVDQAAKKAAGIRGRQLIIGGKVDAEARSLLEQRGWEVQDRQYARLLVRKQD